MGNQPATVQGIRARITKQRRRGCIVPCDLTSPDLAIISIVRLYDIDVTQPDEEKLLNDFIKIAQFLN